MQVPERYKKPYEPQIVDDTRRTLAGMITCLDEAIGNVTQTLKETGLYDDTIIIFISGKEYNVQSHIRHHVLTICW